MGDSAGHCLPLTAEGIRTAFYFAIALGEELRSVVEGRKTREDALRDYAAFNDSHEWKFSWMLRAQRSVPRLPARVQRGLVAAAGRKRFVDWSFEHYLGIARPRSPMRHVRLGEQAAVVPELASLADDQERPGEEQSHSDDPSGVIGVSSRPRKPIRSSRTEKVSWPVIVAAATPRRRSS